MRSFLLLSIAVASLVLSVYRVNQISPALVQQRIVLDEDDKINESLSSSRGESIKAENKRVGESGEKIFSHFFSHIPKTGATHAMFAVNSLLYNTPEWLALKKEDRFRACHQAEAPVGQFDSKFYTDFKKTRCAMWMTEQPYSVKAHHVYTLLRNPVAHVVSQFFHCKESSDHKKYRYRIENVTLTEWLQTWHQARNDSNLQRSLEDKFYCYKPINKQSAYVPSELKYAYDVVGDQSQMDLSVCMIAIRFSGFVPPQCNCSDLGPQRRKLRLDHGVTHHGDSHALNDEQLSLIRDLTDRDQVLYEEGQLLFADQVAEVEAEYAINLCRSIRKEST